MLTGITIYLGGMLLTWLLVLMTPSPRPSRKDWAFILLLWPMTILAMMAMGASR